jgi:hypothetical protein
MDGVEVFKTYRRRGPLQAETTEKACDARCETPRVTLELGIARL